MGQSPSSKNYTDNPNDNILVQGNADLKDGKVVPRLWTKEITKTIDKDGIILTVRAPVGDVARTDYKVVLGRGVAGIKGNDYIYQFLQKLQNNRYWVSLSSGSTFESINSNDIKDLIIDIPSIEEQTKISMLLNNVNSIITLHQRKLEHLKLKKKSLLQKLFPKEGEVYPELRFPGFTDPWEQRKLGDVVGITSGFMGDSLLSDGKYHLTRIETIADGIVDENRVGYSNEKPDDMYLLKHGDILYSNINSISHMGKVAKYQGNSPLYHGINLLRLQPENNINSDFLLYLLNTEKCRNWAKTRANQAVSQASINQSLLTTQEIAISSFEEQKKIGDYFRNLDHLITLHQRKLEHLQLLKKALLQQLFV